MALTYATIEMANQPDEYKEAEGIIDATNIRRCTGQCLVDTGAVRMAITRKIKVNSAF